MSKFGKLLEGLRTVRVTYSNGDTVTTDMAAGLSDEEIKDYFKIGKEFNIGSGENDLMARVTKVEILESRKVCESDPTYTEMMRYLKDKFRMLVDWRDGGETDAAVAIYYFASDYHSGQWSNLYKAISQSGYHPGPFTTKEKEGEQVVDFYDDLVAHYG